MVSKNSNKDRVTKELALLITPLLTAYLFVAFYEAGYCSFFGIPYELIDINFTDVLLTNRLTLMVVVIAFLWISLYYNVLPSANSPVFRGMITLILFLSLWLGSWFGGSDAQQKQDFLVMTLGEKDYALIKIYDDKMILSPINKANKTFKKAFHVVKIGQFSQYQLIEENIGPLLPE
ncbi:MAG: hypothetical protein H7A33_01120 [Deltaproteobacteria bacterium]|nr:hypothetical protein [Deltaproteobacteria bacterium]